MRKKKEIVFEEIIPISQIKELLVGKTALVFGGSGGIGESICANLLNAGARTIAVGRNPYKIKALAVKFPKLKTMICEVSDRTQIDKLFDALDSCPDIIINSAGVFLSNDKQRDLLLISEDDWDNTLQINYNSNLYILNKYSNLRESKVVKKKFICISSVDGMKPSQTVYSISKACLNQYLIDYARNDKEMTIYIVSPGPTATATMSADMKFKYYREDHPDLRCAVPQDIGNLVTFLSAEDCHFETGTIIKCDGGMT